CWGGGFLDQPVALGATPRGEISDNSAAPRIPADSMSTLFLHSPPAQDKDTTTPATIDLAHDRNPAFFIYLKPGAFPNRRLGSDLPNTAPKILRPARYSALPYRGIYHPITSSVRLGYSWLVSGSHCSSVSCC
ncbi:Uncharacterized protein HZ326_30063, partial [Fusarium oxysporum f. sp. albedinis]